MNLGQRMTYIAERGNVCPFCGTDEIEAQLGFEVGHDAEVWQIVFCMDDDCSRQWRDIYTLTHVEEADEHLPRVGVKVP